MTETTALLQQENITRSALAFRNAVSEPAYAQGDAEGVREIFGMDSEGAELNQPLGECSTPAGRSLAWVNNMQHQVQPFELADPSRPGHRKILCFFLVDGATPVPSTATCPPQQADWMAAELLAMPLFFRLPKEVFAKIAGLVVATDAAPTPSPRVSLSTDVGQWLRWVGDPLDREPQGQWEVSTTASASTFSLGCCVCT